MKVLRIAQMIKGGPASYLQEVLSYQVDLLGKENVTLLAPGEEWAYLEWLDPTCRQGMSGKSRTAAGLLRSALEARAVIRRIKPDVVHLHSSFAGALVRIGYLLPHRRRPAIVYCAHGWAFNMKVPEYRRRLYARIERSLAAASDAIVCISRFEYQQALERGLPPQLLRLIANGIADLEADVVEPARVYREETLNLLYVGRQDRQKGFDVLEDAMRLLRHYPITLHAVGEAVVSRKERKEKEEELPNIVRHGWRARDEVRSFMAGADVLVMPSRWEGFGLAAVEAMRQRLPVCASAVDALPELVREGVSGYLFPPEDSAALARLLATLDRPSLRSMGPDARRWYLQNFTADRMNRLLIALYREVLEARNGQDRG